MEVVMFIAGVFCGGAIVVTLMRETAEARLAETHRKVEGAVTEIVGAISKETGHVSRVLREFVEAPLRRRGLLPEETKRS